MAQSLALTEHQQCLHMVLGSHQHYPIPPQTLSTPKLKISEYKEKLSLLKQNGLSNIKPIQFYHMKKFHRILEYHVGILSRVG